MTTAYIVGGLVTYVTIIWAYCRYWRGKFEEFGDDVQLAAAAIVPCLIWPLALAVGAVVFLIRRN